jgi:hypothetical protein
MDQADDRAMRTEAFIMKGDTVVGGNGANRRDVNARSGGSNGRGGCGKGIAVVGARWEGASG